MARRRTSAMTAGPGRRRPAAPAAARTWPGPGWPPGPAAAAGPGRRAGSRAAGPTAPAWSRATQTPLAAELGRPRWPGRASSARRPTPFQAAWARRLVQYQSRERTSAQPSARSASRERRATGTWRTRMTASSSGADREASRRRARRPSRARRCRSAARPARVRRAGWRCWRRPSRRWPPAAAAPSTVPATSGDDGGHRERAGDAADRLGDGDVPQPRVAAEEFARRRRPGWRTGRGRWRARRVRALNRSATTPPSGSSSSSGHHRAAQHQGERAGRSGGVVARRGRARRGSTASPSEDRVRPRKSSRKARVRRGCGHAAKDISVPNYSSTNISRRRSTRRHRTSRHGAPRLDRRARGALAARAARPRPRRRGRGHADEKAVRPPAPGTRAVPGRLRPAAPRVRHAAHARRARRARRPPPNSPRDLDLAPASVTGRLDGLEQRGFIRRTPSTTDRRRVDVELTDAGRATWLGAMDVLGHEEYRLLGVLSRMNASQLNDMLRRVMLARRCKSGGSGEHPSPTSPASRAWSSAVMNRRLRFGPPKAMLETGSGTRSRPIRVPSGS